jgi:hypothetical protein
MFIRTLLIAGLTLALGISAVIPALADRDEDRGNDRGQRRGPKVTVRVNNAVDPAETRAFHQWYGTQAQRYNDFDSELGARTGDFLLLVTDVTPGRIMVLDRQNVRKAVFVTDKTRVTFAKPGDRRSPEKRSPYGSTPMPFYPGDLVVVQGILRAEGGVLATRVSIVGHSYGWGDDYSPYPEYHGYRAWGEIRYVDARRQRLEVSANTGRKILLLDEDTRILANGQHESFRYLRPGQRVVFYYTDEGYSSVRVTRLVVLRPGDTYPQGDRPHWADPDYSSDGWERDDHVPGISVEGRLEYISSGLIFNRLVIRTDHRKEVQVMAFKGLQAVERNGTRIPLADLRAGEELRITYTNLGDLLLADRIEIR